MKEPPYQTKQQIIINTIECWNFLFEQLSTQTLLCLRTCCFIPLCPLCKCDKTQQEETETETVEKNTQLSMIGPNSRNILAENREQRDIFSKIESKRNISIAKNCLRSSIARLQT